MNVLIPLDATPSEEGVLAYCRNLAIGADPTFVLAHILPLPRFIDPDRASASEHYLAEVARTFREAGMHVTTLIRQGEPGPQIVALARLLDVDSIVLPSHRGHWVDGHPHEAVLEYLLLNADRPVIAISDLGYPATPTAAGILVDRAARGA